MPAGAVGVWYMDQYQSSPRPYVPNSVAARPVSANLLQAPRRLFNNTQFYGKTQATVTDLAATAPDGSNDASRIVGNAADWYVYPTPSVTYPAGTYTVGVTARVHGGGANQSFRMGIGPTLVAKTATASYQRFSATVTLAAASHITWLVRGPDSSTAGDLDIIDAGVYAGAVDLGEPVPEGHMIIGKNFNNSTAVYAGGLLDLTASGASGVLQFQNDLALTEYTLVSLLQKKTNAKTINAILSKVSDYGAFGPLLENAKTTQSWFRANNRASALTGTWSFYNRGFKTHSHRISATNCTVFVNGVPIVNDVYVPGAAISLREIFVGLFNDYNSSSDLEIASFALFNRALSNSEIAAAEAVLRAHSSSVPINDDDVYWMAEGDSITVDPNSYCLKVGATSTTKLLGARKGVNGGTVAGLVSRSAEIDAMIPAVKGNKRFFLSVLIGANDLTGSATVAQFLIDLAAYCDARRAAGWKVILCTILPNTNPGFNTKRNSANATISTWLGVHCDALCDFAADATMGPDAAASNATYYPDGVHPSNAGHTILAPYLVAAIDALAA